MARAAADGALSIGGAVAVKLIAANTLTPDDAVGVDGYIFACPENLGSMSGAMKEMVDQLYYPLLGALAGKPYAMIIAAGTDGHGAVRQWHRIAAGWRLRQIAEPIIVITGADTPGAIMADKHVAAADIGRATALGAAMAEGLIQGIF